MWSRGMAAKNQPSKPLQTWRLSTLEIAKHLLARAAAGERDLEVLKSSALAKLLGDAERFTDHAA